ncbi:MAG: membrane protein insertion efficiency factor YidD [Rubrivivax sp.]|nr:membrane protein insertion efficiency factor YidD [Rubrivivax sp.]
MHPELWPRRLLAGLVHGYRLLLKPWLGSACRFEPTCSAYALQALQRHGAVGGTALTGWRLLRCHPWCDGGVDPVPARLREGLSSRCTGWLTRLVPEGHWSALPPVVATAQTDPPSIESTGHLPHRPGPRAGEPT